MHARQLSGKLTNGASNFPYLWLHFDLEVLQKVITSKMYQLQGFSFTLYTHYKEPDWFPSHEKPILFGKINFQGSFTDREHSISPKYCTVQCMLPSTPCYHPVITISTYINYPLSLISCPLVSNEQGGEEKVGKVWTGRDNQIDMNNHEFGKVSWNFIDLS